ncbi:MAG: LysR family transcriptional regulator [Polyangiaceae bacterium]|nr:LysR family transcriptional regulator [Polyangiaceae bacterium]
MDWEDLRITLAVARAGSVAAAARQLGVAHTTVYRRLLAFEEASGVRFFARVDGAYVATEAGRELFEMGEQVEQRIVAIERKLSGQDLRLDGEVTVTTVEPLAIELSEHLAAFRRAHPAIRIRLHVTNANVDLARREADIALRATNAPEENLVGRKLTSIAFAVYASKSYARGGKLKIQDADWICFDASLAKTPQARWEAANVPPERIVMSTDSRAVFAEAVATGTGIGVLPCGVAARIPNVMNVTGTLTELTMPLWLLTHPDVAKVPRVRAVLEHLSAAVERERALFEGPPPA